MTPFPLTEAPYMSLARTGPLDIMVSKTNHDRALLYLHGFPGPFVKLPPGELRIADELHDVICETHDLYYPLYTLTHDAPFSFEDSIVSGKAALDFLLEQKTYRSVEIVGQSWGAVIALALAQADEVSSVILITPFVRIPTGKAAAPTVKHYSATYPELLPELRFDEFVDQIKNVADRQNPIANIAACRARLAVIASERDEVIPLDAVKSAIALSPGVQFVVLPNQTHQVEDRAAFREAFRELFL